MDVFAHGVWSGIIFRKVSVWKAALVGVLPDVLSWGTYIVYRLLTNTGFGRPDLTAIPSWVFVFYGVTHSLIVATIVLGSLWFALGKKFPLYLLAWPIHIVLDVPLHSADFLPTPFLWPVSTWVFPGVSWGEKWLWIGNWILISIALLFVWWEKKKEKEMGRMQREKVTSREAKNGRRKS